MLAGTLSTSMLPAMVNSASAEETATTSYVDTLNQTKLCYMNGVYTTIVNNTPVYVYLGNEVENKFLIKEEALFRVEMNYEKVYVFKKTVKNPNYVNDGETPRNITVYALSGKSSVSGWTRVNKNEVNSYNKIATSIELGEFLLKDVNLYAYNYNMLGFAYADINKDGYANELVYIGNNKINKLMTKEDAIRYAVSNFENYYIQSKTVSNPDYVYGVNSKTIKVYAISEKSYVAGWTRVNKSKVPNDAMVSSSIEYMNLLVHINANKVQEDYVYNPSVPVIPSKPTFTYNYMKKDAALSFAYQNYPMFCILTKTVYNPNSNEAYVIYAFSTETVLEGWEPAFNDTIHPDSCIFLTMQDAYNYEAELQYNFSKKLK